MRKVIFSLCAQEAFVLCEMHAQLPQAPEAYIVNILVYDIPTYIWNM